MIPSQHSHNIVKQMRVAMAFGLKCTSSHPRKFMIATRNLLGGSPNPATRWDSKQTMVEPWVVGTSTSGIEEIGLPVSQPKS
jgi:hypothetical protein